MDTRQAAEHLQRSLNTVMTYCKMIGVDIHTASFDMAKGHLTLLEKELNDTLGYANMIADGRHLRL